MGALVVQTRHQTKEGNLDGNEIQRKSRPGFASSHDPAFRYRIGATVECPNYDDDIRVECTRGIHFFLTRKEAEAY